MDDTTNKMDDDIFSKLINERAIFLSEEINAVVANKICATLLYLDLISPEREISLFINSPGGEMDGFFAIYDTLHYISSPVKTICINEASSAAAILLAAGSPGQRFAFPHSKIMIHDVYGSNIFGTKKDLGNEIKNLASLSKIFLKILAEHTGRSLKKIQNDCEHDMFMTADEALKYGIIDEIIGNKKEKLFKIKTAKAAKALKKVKAII